MKKVIIVDILCLVIIVFFCGCTENQGNKTVTLSVQGLLEDRALSTSISGGVWTSKIDYESLNEGDTLIITDEISKIRTSSDGTIITFDVNYTYSQTNVTLTELDFRFEGDLTDKYAIGDTVRITLTVYHITYTNETSGLALDYEVFEEGWNQTYFEQNYFFTTNFFYQIFPENAISKVE